MNAKHILIAALLAGAFTQAMAREAAEPHDVVRERFVINGADAAIAHGFDQASLGTPLVVMHPKQLVKNAPYSAEVVSERTQNLSDGNQIVNKSSSMSYRDSAGRTRQETRNAAGAVSSITINDAVEGVIYILNPDAKTATKLPARSDVKRITGEKARVLMEEMRKEHQQAREDIIVKRVERSDADAGQRVRENVRIQISRQMVDGRPMPGMEDVGPMIAGAFGDMKWSAKASRKDLGTKDIDGVKAQGKLRSYEIPAGEIGNRNAIVVTTETWYSPELQVTLLSKHSDPRNGERTYRLEGLKREEPAAALFTLPSDYTVKDTPTHKPLVWKK
jgi:hypothetical protein